MKYIKGLSRKQRVWLVVGALLVAALFLYSFIEGRTAPSISMWDTSLSESIQDIAPKLNITGKSLARELKLPLDVDKTVPVGELGVSEEDLEESVHHLIGHTDSNAKYYIYLALVIWGWIFLVVIGRPAHSELAERRVWFPKTFYTVALFLSVGVAGMFFGKSPNPMEGVVKVFKSMIGLYPDPWIKVAALLLFIGLVIVGNKLICGWACPFGALQELFYKIPLLNRFRKYKLPFVFTNTVRIVLFLVTLSMMFGWLGGRKGMVIYHYVNPFNLFNLDFESVSIICAIVVSLVVGIFFYRPFCSFICPFGLISWFFERLSLFRVRIDHEKCTECMACVKACPSSATKGMVAKKFWQADCFSCSRCLNVCPVDAIKYKSVFKR